MFLVIERQIAIYVVNMNNLAHEPAGLLKDLYIYLSPSSGHVKKLELLYIASIRR